MTSTPLNTALRNNRIHYYYFLFQNALKLTIYNWSSKTPSVTVIQSGLYAPVPGAIYKYMYKKKILLNSDTVETVFSIFHVEPAVEGVLRAFSNDHTWPCLYMVKHKNLLLQNQESFEAEYRYIMSGREFYQVCWNCDSWLTFHFLCQGPHTFALRICWKM